MPYMYLSSKKGVKNIAVRFSEYEDISIAKQFKNKLSWIWIDTVTKLPIDKNNITYFSNSVFGLFIEIMYHRLKFWKKGKKWLH